MMRSRWPNGRASAWPTGAARRGGCRGRPAGWRAAAPSTPRSTAEVGDRDLAEALERADAVEVERVDVGRGRRSEPELDELPTVRSPRPSMSMAPRDAKCSMRASALAGQLGVHAERVALALEARPAAAVHDGHTLSGTSTAASPSGRTASTGPTTSGITSPALRTMTVSPGRTSLSRDLVLVVQRGHADGGAADEHRLEHGERRGLAGAPDRHHDVLEQRRALFGRELERDRPPRRLATSSRARRAARGRRPSPPRRRSRSRGRGGAPGQCWQYAYTVVERVHDADLGVDRQPEPPRYAERLAVARERRPALAPRRAGRSRTTSSRLAVIGGSFWRSDPAAELRGLANSRSPGLGLSLVQRLERGQRHVDLAPHLEQRRAALPFSRVGTAAMVRDVGGDVLADAAVAAGRRLHVAARSRSASEMASPSIFSSHT